MSTEPTEQRPLLPRHVIASIVSAVLGLIALILTGLWIAFAAAGNIASPPVGLGPLLSAIIAVLWLVPIAHWAAHCAAKPGLDKIEQLRGEVRSALDTFGEKALQAAHQAGEWKGMLNAEMRENPSLPDDFKKVVNMMERAPRR